jgi:plastocyanin
MHTRTLVLSSVAAAALITLAACSSSSSTASPASGTSSSSGSSSGKITIGSDQANDHGTEDATGKSTFEIEADNDSSGYYFKPTILQGSGGQSITLEIKNEGSVPHNFSITSMNVNVNIEPGASQEVKVTFPQTGTVEFFCSFHHALGMAGELSVA